MIRFRPMYVDVSVVVSAAPVRRTKARAKASVASSEIRTTKGVSFRGFVTSFFRTPERSSTGSSLPPVPTFRTMPSSTFKAPTTDEAAFAILYRVRTRPCGHPQGRVRRRWSLHRDVDGKSVPLFPQEFLRFAGELPHDLACRFHTLHPAYAFTRELTHGIDVACRCREERDGREMRHWDLDIGSPGADPPTDDVALESFGSFDRGAEDPVRRIPAGGKRLREDGVFRFGGDELLEVGGMGLGFGRRDESRAPTRCRRPRRPVRVRIRGPRSGGRGVRFSRGHVRRPPSPAPR